MDADLDLLLTAVYVTADDLLPDRPKNARRSVTDAEVVTLCVAQAIVGHSVGSAGAPRGQPINTCVTCSRVPRPAGLLQAPPASCRDAGVADRCLRESSPGFHRRTLLVDSTPVECARSRETVKRSALGDAADYGYCSSHSRFFWGFRLHAVFAPDGTPRALALTSPSRMSARGRTETARSRPTHRWRDRDRRQGLRRTSVRGWCRKNSTPRSSDPPAKTRPAQGLLPTAHPPVRQRIESIFWTCKDLLTLERHGARTLAGHQRAHRATPTSPSPPRSPSTTNSADPPAHSSTTGPDPGQSTVSPPGRRKRHQAARTPDQARRTRSLQAPPHRHCHSPTYRNNFAPTPPSRTGV